MNKNTPDVTATEPKRQPPTPADIDHAAEHLVATLLALQPQWDHEPVQKGTSAGQGFGHRPGYYTDTWTRA